eukprot:TRINITY_DN106628_c0_g1_i1.p1 TRINITY_DN106628_c0_g1~~TRINITY_DN106628_c0_g1_i1.p1  ORF type:complete len:346 (+),score=42.31 TRINITY_DN106628_c0_g1_i1:102-1139(+)
MAWLSMFGCGKSQSQSRRSKEAPHPIPEGKLDVACPITGLTANGVQDPRGEMARDPDILEEKAALAAPAKGVHKSAHDPGMLQGNTSPPGLLIRNRTFKPTEKTRQLLRDIGGLPVLIRFTELFYEKAFVDPHLDKFIRSHDDPHGQRFALWIAEKLGEGTPWTEERRTRPRTVLLGREVSYDRESSHIAAMNSPKREAHKHGLRFSLADTRVWMRIHFWAAREVGLLDNAAWAGFYVRFIGHFVSVYNPHAPRFARDSMRWSADPNNIREYHSAGNRMPDLIDALDVTRNKESDAYVRKALAALPQEELVYDGDWPNYGTFETPVHRRTFPWDLEAKHDRPIGR